MNNIIKISIFTGILAVTFGIFAFVPGIVNDNGHTLLSPDKVFAWGNSGCGSCDDGGGSYGGNGDDYTPPSYPAVCNYLKADNKTGTITLNSAKNVNLSWDTYRANSVSIDNGIGNVSKDGSKSVYVDHDITYKLTAKGTGGNDSCYVTIKIDEPEPAQCEYLKINGKTNVNLPYGGSNVNLTWDTTNTDSVSINNGIGSVSDDGSKSVFVNSDTTFVLTAYGTDGNDTCTATVNVGEQQAPKCDFLNASDYHVDKGDNVTLTWGTTNASDVYINNGIGNVSADGSRNVTIYNDITYILTAENGNQEDACQVTIKVDEPVKEYPKCDYFRVDDDDVEEGDEVELEWGTTNADKVYINHGIGYVSDDGTEEVSVYDDITYILTVYNDGEEDECEVDINVDEKNNSKTPKCELDISDDRVKAGDVVTLSWETKYAEEITIEDDHGEEIFNSSRSKYFDGEIDVRVYKDTEFTLNVEGEDRDRDCSVDVKVDDEDITIYQHRDIEFTKVPYTGFEAGPALATLFYSLLVLWALFIAYVLVIKRDSVLGFRLREAAVADVETGNELKKKVQSLLNQHNNLGW